MWRNRQLAARCVRQECCALSSRRLFIGSVMLRGLAEKVQERIAISIDVGIYINRTVLDDAP